MKIIGADLGYSLSGKTAIVLIDTDGQPVLLDSFSVTLPAGARKNGAWFPRLHPMVDQFSRWLDNLSEPPDGFAFEGVYLNKNARVTIALATLGGLMAGVALSHRIPTVRVYAVQAKIALTGRKDAKKIDMQTAAKHIFGQNFDEHTADAIGIALHGESVLRLHGRVPTDAEVIILSEANAPVQTNI